jgi:hypothetical protein
MRADEAHGTEEPQHDGERSDRSSTKPNDYRSSDAEREEREAPPPRWVPLAYDLEQQPRDERGEVY